MQCKILSNKMYMWKIFIKYKNIELQWRIQDFPKACAKTIGGGLFFENCMKEIKQKGHASIASPGTATEIDSR